jgi:hypothetical protein
VRLLPHFTQRISTGRIGDAEQSKMHARPDRQNTPLFFTFTVLRVV